MMSSSSLRTSRIISDSMSATGTRRRRVMRIVRIGRVYEVLVAAGVRRDYLAVSGHQHFGLLVMLLLLLLLVLLS